MRQQYSRDIHDDEIDLFELAGELWREKLLIAAVTLVVFLSTLAYVLLVPTVYTYSVQTTLRPGSLHQYGPLAAALRTEGKQSMEVAVELADTSFLLLRKNLESALVQQEFFQLQANEGAVLVEIEIPIDPRDRLARDDLSLGTIVISASSTLEQGLKNKLEQYLEFASNHTVNEVNGFLAGLGTDQQIASDMLYSVEKPIDSMPVEVAPKKKLILVVGFVLGGMLGIFAALVRSAIRKRMQPAR